MGDLYIFALLADTSKCKQSYISCQSKDLVEKIWIIHSGHSTASICSQMNKRQQRKPILLKRQQKKKKKKKKGRRNSD